MAIPTCSTYAMSFRVTCSVFTILPHNYSHMSIFLFPPYVNWNSCLPYNKVLFLCIFHFLMWSLLLMLHPLIRPFIFRVLGYLYQFVVPGPVPCLGLILPWRNFRLLPSCSVGWPSTSLVRLLPCIWITVLLGHTCVIKVVQCLLFFPDWPARYWVWLTSMLLLFFQHTFLPTSMWRQISVLGSDASGVAPSSSGGSGRFSLLGPSRGGPPGIFLFYSMPTLFHFGNSIACGVLGVECLQPSSEISGKFCVSSSSSGPSCSVQVSSRTCQWSTQTFASGGSMLDGGSLASHHSQHAGRCSSMVPSSKKSCCGCFGRPGAQGSAISVFHPLAAQQHVLCRQGFSSLVCQAVAGAAQMSTSRVYQQSWKEWAGWCAQQGLPNNALSAPILANFFVTFVSGGTSMAYHWYLSFCYFCIFGTSLHSQGI